MSKKIINLNFHVKLKGDDAFVENLPELENDVFRAERLMHDLINISSDGISHDVSVSLTRIAFNTGLDVFIGNINEDQYINTIINFLKILQALDFDYFYSPIESINIAYQV